jgi:cysteine-rich repeat protein
VCKWNKLPDCGDGILQPDTEQCDQGPYNGDYRGTPCRANCLLPYCGDGSQDANEECDDENNLNNDGCSAACTLESRAASGLQGDILSDRGNPYPTTQSSEPTYANIPTPARTPTGPGLLIFLASGAAAGIGLARRRFLTAT